MTDKHKLLSINVKISSCRAILIFLFSFAYVPLLEANPITKIGFAPNMTLSIGSSFNIQDISRASERCVDHSEIKFIDTAGAISSKLRVYSVATYDDIENDFKYSYKASAISKAGIEKLASAKTTLTNNGKFDLYLKNIDNSLNIVVEASAWHGRRGFTDYSLKPEYKALIDSGNIADFISKCGTHFVASAEHESSIRVIIRISNLDRQMKNVFMNDFKLENEGSVSLKKAGLSAGFSSSVASTLSNSLSVISKHSTIDIKIDSEGGQGIASLADAIVGVNISSEEGVKDVLSSVASSAKDFTQAMSAPSEYNVVPYAELENVYEFLNQEEFEKIGSIYKVLLRLDYLLEQYSQYKVKSEQLFNTYFKLEFDNLSALRDKVYAALFDCRTKRECDFNVPTYVHGFFLDDVIESGNVKLTCPADYSGTRNGEKINVLTSLYVTGRGKTRFDGELIKDAIEVVKIIPPSTLTYVRLDAARNLRVSEKADDNGMRDVFFTLDIVPVDRATFAPGDELTDVKLTSIANLRTELANTYFGLRFRTKRGEIVEDIFGKPNLAACELYTSR